MNLACKYLAIVCVNVVCYYQSLSGDFVFDDSVAIIKNKDVYGFNSNTFKVSNSNQVLLIKNSFKYHSVIELILCTANNLCNNFLSLECFPKRFLGP